MGDRLQKVVVTGAAGFVGSTLVDSLLNQGIEVIGIDNLSTGRIQFLENARLNPKFTFLEKDIFTGKNLDFPARKIDAVFHFAANADVRFGPDHPSKDLEQNTIATHNVLEASRKAEVKKFIFSSTGSVYGEAKEFPTTESAPFPVQTSLYGASKLACEGMIAAYAESFGIQAWIFRFVSILGPRYTHGHIFDFFSQLTEHPESLTVLGDGHQRKSYLHVDDCIHAINIALENSHDLVNLFNLGVDGSCEVRDSINWITNELGLSPEIKFGTESRGWIGDNPLIHLDTRRIREIGWSPKFSIEESVRATVKYMRSNYWIFEGKNFK
jgi:UDP-glucose 4-epimerase